MEREEKKKDETEKINAEKIDIKTRKKRMNFRVEKIKIPEDDIGYFPNNFASEKDYFEVFLEEEPLFFFELAEEVFLQEEEEHFLLEEPEFLLLYNCSIAIAQCWDSIPDGQPAFCQM